MDFEEKYQKVIEETTICKCYRLKLSTRTSTTLPYIFLGASQINRGDTVVRKGKVAVESPLLIIPKNIPQFFGFDFEENLDIDDNNLISFFMLRGISFPSLKYTNEISTIEVEDKNPQEAISFYKDEIERKEDLQTGLIFGPVEYWQLSIIFYVNFLINRSARNDIDQYLRELRRRLLGE